MANRLCKNPATVFGLKNRGVIQKGAFADITLFDKETVGENNNFCEPTLAPSGIPYVIVNGEIKVEKGQMTNICSGRLIKRN
ncbi:MAG: D-aminoacylase, partial [Clostridia bacterium]|nr:D-aminoacylase [Clostridia bacterium]